ncbi:MAG: M10 family metallopeptidase domain-containing protein [Fibrobacterota bacterium]|nr:M10 family metallopeptidase domain-containing protein [Fibrobacterota bacterium]
MDDLTGGISNGHWSITNYSNLSNPFPVDAVMSSADLHNLLQNWRNSTGVYSNANRENFRDWHMDVLCVNNQWTSPATGVLFDEPDWSTIGGNGAGREAVALLWTLERREPKPNEVHAWNAAHEIGHALGLTHTSAGTATNREIMDPIFRGTNMQWLTWQRNWITKAPESWVKTGKYAQPRIGIFPFRQYLSGTICNDGSCAP